MMSVIVAIACSVALLNVEEVGAKTTSHAQVVNQDEKVKIKADELPAPVKSTLDGQDYSGWAIDSAFKYTTTETYEVVLKKGDEKKTLKFDKMGKEIE